MSLELRIHYSIARLCQSWIILAVDADEEPLEEWEAEDDVKGGPLDPREVKTVREKEIEYLWDMKVYEYSTEAEARARTGRNLVVLKWIDTNKGSTEAPCYRSRLVCTEVRHKKGAEPIFSATLPLETLRILLGVACQEDVFQVEDPFLISISDVSRAHFHADAGDVYVRLPDEDPKAKQPGVCGKLRKTMYGSLDAAQRWREHYAQVWEAGGFSPGVASPCYFFHEHSCKPTFWCTVTIFSWRADVGERKHALSLLRSAYELSKVVTLGTGVVTVSDSEFFWAER